jgi:acetyl esterase/lipase
VRRALVSIVLTIAVGSAGAAASAVSATSAWSSGGRYRDAVFPKVLTKSDIVYGHAVDQNDTRVTLTFDLYEPKGDTVDSRPVVVWVHGGGFSSGDKTSPELVDEATDLAHKGYVNISINYRLAPQGCVGTVGPACLTGIVQAMQDAQTAVRFLRAHAAKYGIDPTRIAIGGSSAGAITALNVGYNEAHPGPGPNQKFSSAVEAVQSLSGAAIGTSPDADGAPAVLFHGTADPLVPYSWAKATVKEAHQAGLVAKLVTFTGDGHVPYLKHRDEIVDKTTTFFYQHLDLAHAAR